MDIILFLLLGIGIGTFGTLVGIGGGLICVPIFILCMSDGGIYPYFHTAGQIAGTSLVVVFANALSGTLAYIRQKRVFFDAAIPFALATLLHRQPFQHTDARPLFRHLPAPHVHHHVLELHA